MRRVLAWAALALLLAAAAAGVGWRYLTREGPEALRRQLEARLSESLATRVTVGPVRLALDRRGIELAAADLGAYPADAGPALVAEGVEVRLDLWAALAGEIRVRGLELVRPALRLRRTASGLELDAGTGARAPDEGEGPREPWHRTVARVLPYLGLREGQVRVVDGVGAGRDLEIRDLSGVAARGWLGSGIEIEAEGAVRSGGRDAGHLSLEASSDDGSEIRLRFEELDVALVAALAGSAAARELAPRGRASGALEAKLAGASPRSYELELTSSRLHVEPRVGGRPSPIDLADARVSLRGTPGRVAGRARVGPLEVPFRATWGPKSLRSLRLEAVDLAGLGPLSQGLAEPERSRVQKVLRQLPAGRVSELELTWEAEPRHGASPLIHARVGLEDGVLLVGSTRLEGVGASAVYEGDVLEVRGAHARLDGRPLPALDLRLAGLARTRGLSELRCLEPGPAPDLPGRRPLAEWAGGGGSKESPRAWKRLRFSADWIEHPALLCAVEGVAGTLEPGAGAGGLRLHLERAVWAGVPVTASVDYHSAPEEGARVRLELGPPFEPTVTELHRAAWAQGRFDLEVERLGPWKARSAAGGFRARGARISVDEALLRLDPGPPVNASIDLDLDLADRVPFDFRGEVGPGTLPDLYAAAGWTEALTGSLVGSLSVRGALRPGSELLASADGAFSLHAREGAIRQQFRLLLAVAMASETLNPFRERGTIRYRAMDASGRIQNGSYWIDAFSIDGPALRAAASGRVGATGARETELVMGLFFFRTVDSVLGRVPILNRVMLGKDDNLIGAYVAITGPWDHLGARVIPTRTLMKGPVGFVFEGLPSFVMGSLRRVQTLLPAGSGLAKEDS